MLEARHITISVARPAAEAYEAIWRPKCFATWASGLSQADLRRDDVGWVASGPEGPIRIDFTDHNAFGVMDHVVHLGTGQRISVPMRIVGNDGGSEVTLTLFRQPGMSDETFARDIAWVERDLAALKRLLEGG